MIQFIIIPLAIILIVTLTQCGATIPLTKEQEILVSHKEAIIEEIPTWFVNMPEDPSFVYAQGTGISDSLQASMFQALMNAKHVLADKIGSRMDGYYKVFESGTRTATAVRSERLISSKLDNVDITGYKIKEVKINRERTLVRTYILLEYSTIDKIAREKF
jgi:hypothetical protein